MGTIPSPDIAQFGANIGVNAANIYNNRLAEYAQVAQIKQATDLAKQQEQTAALANQEKQRQLQDQDALTKTLAQYDPEKHSLAEIPKLVTQNGGSGQAALNAQAGLIKQRTDYAKLSDADFAREQKKADLTQGVHDQVSQAPADQKQQVYQRGLETLAKAGVDVSKEPMQYPGDDAFAQHLPAIRLHSAVLGEAEKERETKAKEQTAAAAGQNAHARELAATRAPAAEQEFQAYYKPWLEANNLQPSAANEIKARDLFLAKHRAQNANPANSDDVKSIADGIESGDQPPTLTGLYRWGGPVRAELARRGVPIAKMETDWKATQKYMSSLNSTQQVRLRQAIDTASDSLDKIDGLYGEWQKLAPTTGFKVWNRATLGAAKQLPGRAGAVATALDAQIADLTSELGNVYMGGNSPTDHSLSLAGKNLSSEWNKETFEEALKQARANIGIRKNSITHGAPAGVSADSTYTPKPTPAAAAHVIRVGTKRYQYKGSGDTADLKNYTELP